MKVKRWLASFVLASILIAIVLSLITYIIDPYYYYRYDNSIKFIHSRYATAGLIKNYDYDTAIIGSSMIQNFNMDSFRQKYQWEPLKMTIGGLSLSETLQLYHLAEKEDKASRYIISLDLHTIAKQDFESPSKFPEYLYNDSVLDDYKYLLGYEVWTRFIPVDIGLLAINSAGVTLPQKFVYSTSVDKIEDWSLDYVFSGEAVFQRYNENSFTVSNIESDDLKLYMNKNLQRFIDELEINADKEYIFIFPPYSILYWHLTYENNQFEEFMDVKKKFVENMAEYENVTVIDMQSIDQILILDEYRDMTHFSTNLQEMMVDAIDDSYYYSTPKNVESDIDRLRSMVVRFDQLYKEKGEDLDINNLKKLVLKE